MSLLLQIRRIGIYLHGNKGKEIIFRPGSSKGLEYYADADFAGNWNHVDANNSGNDLSSIGFRF